MLRRNTLAALCCCIASIGAASAAQTFSMKLLAPSEIQSTQSGLDTTLLPDRAAHLQIVRGQAFRVQDANNTVVTLLPVTFSTSEPGLVKEISRDTDRCGVYLLQPGKQTRFEPLPEDETAGAIQCSGVAGVGLSRTGGTHAQVLLLFRLHTVRRTWSEPYAVSWSENDRRFVLEHISPPAGVSHSRILTIAEVRRWLQSSAPK